MMLLGLLAAQAAVGVLVGQAFLASGRAVEPNLTACTLSAAQLAAGELFCDAGEGPMWTPANLTANMWFPACTSTYLIEEMAEFNRREPWELVRFPARRGDAGQEDAQLSAWWLPARHPQAPRVVVVHGLGGNANDWSVQLAAYFLRSLGFAVLLPSLRDFGFSSPRGANASKVTWGWAYHLDVLGAWDYATRDPDRRLGGALAPDMVGLQGVSIGGFAAAVAAGLEERVPGLWLDTPVFDPQTLLRFQLRQLVGAVSAPLFLNTTWLLANRFAEVELDLATPAKVLPQSRRDPGARKCNVGAVAGLNDRLVPDNEAAQLLRLLRDHPAGRYPVLVDEQAAATCGSSDHLTLPVWAPDAYREKLCHFWTTTFAKPRTFCKLEELPRFAMTVAATTGWQERPRRPQLQFIR